jgi:hypothetical protein
MRKALFALVLLVTAAGAAGAWWMHRSKARPDPAEALFARTLPSWIVARAGGSADLEEARAELKKAASPWPALGAPLAAIDADWPDGAKVREAVSALNRAAYDSKLAYWVDVQTIREQPILLTYRVEGRALWKADESSIEVLRVRRLDDLNVEMGLGGHADGDLPIVLVERVEETLMEEVGATFESPAPGNAVDQLARARFRAEAEAKSGAPALARAAQQLARRDQLLKDMIGRMKDGTLRLEPPDGLVWGEAFFDRLEPYADRSRRGGPLLLSSDLGDLARADSALASGEGRKALDAALETELLRIEAHEARHALDRKQRDVPPRLLELVGDDDMDFAKSAERELRAYFGELIDGPAPRCVGLTEIGRLVGGKGARLTPHNFAGATLIERLDPAVDGKWEIAEMLERICALPEAELEERLLQAYESFYGEPFVKASRTAAPVVSSDATKR